MNIVLFEADEVDRPLPLADRRAEHVLTVLKRAPGDRFDSGIINGPRGKSRVIAVTASALHWKFEADAGGSPPCACAAASGDRPAPPDPAAFPELWIGLPRPQTARKILQEATALGVSALRFIISDKAEASYAQSTLWTSGEWRRHALAGVEQSFTTQLPFIEFGVDLAATLLAAAGKSVLALDNYEAGRSLADTPLAPGSAVAIVVGSERGWSSAERDQLRAAGAQLVHLGSRVLRTETACVAALAVVRAKLGLG